MSEQGITAYKMLWKAERDLPASVPVLAQLAQRDDGAGYFARLSLADYYSRQNKPGEAAALLRHAIGMRKLAEPKSVALLHETLAVLLEQAGERQAAFEEWSRLLPAPHALLAARRLAPDAVALASVCQAANLYQESLEALKDLSLPDAALWRGRALANLNRYEDSIKEYVAHLTSNPGDSKVRLEYATQLERAGRYAQALKEFETLGQDGLYGKGRVLTALNRKQEAIQAYQASPAADAQRRAGIMLQESGDRERALHAFVSLAARGSHLSQESALRALTICDAVGYRATAAQMEALLSSGGAYLRGLTVEPKTVPDTPTPEPAAIVTAHQIVEVLGDGGLEVARVEVELATHKASDGELLALGEWLRASGEVRVALRIGADVLKRTPSRSAYKLIYPMAFSEHVSKYTSQYSLDPWLVMAIIREESAYEHDVISWAGAVGLMQLMPATAQQIAAKLAIVLGPDSLRDPESNIRLGTTYLKDLLAQFDGNVPRAVAAYNAGPHSVVRWLGTPSAKDNRYFLEAITYVETRGYLLRVLDSWRIYRWLYEGTSH